MGREWDSNPPPEKTGELKGEETLSDYTVHCSWFF